jgi:L-malate glycosyltransferase
MSGVRVLHVIEAMDRGGAESLIVELARHAGPGDELTVCALNRGGPALEAARAAGARVTTLAGTGHGARALRLAALARERRAQVIHGHNPTGGLYAALAGLLVPGAVVVRTEHSLRYPGRHSRFYPALEALANRLTARVICVCEAVRASHLARYPGQAGRFVTIRNGVSDAVALDRGAARRALGLGDEPVALTVGSLTPQKAQDVLLGAFARAGTALPGARLLLAGEGRLRAALEERARALGVAGRVRFLGARDDVDELLAAADVFALSSRREGLPVTLLEAMRAGRAAVATRAGGCGEALADGVTGRLAEPGDEAGLADALVALLGDAVARARMGAAARERWAREFTAARMAAETAALYHAALGRRGGGA